MSQVLEGHCSCWMYRNHWTKVCCHINPILAAYDVLSSHYLNNFFLCVVNIWNQIFIKVRYIWHQNLLSNHWLFIKKGVLETLNFKISQKLWLTDSNGNITMILEDNPSIQNVKKKNEVFYKNSGYFEDAIDLMQKLYTRMKKRMNRQRRNRSCMNTSRMPRQHTTLRW